MGSPCMFFIRGSFLVVNTCFSVWIVLEAILETHLCPSALHCTMELASSCAAKALEAQRAGGERGWNVGGKMGQLRSLLFGPLHRPALSGVQVSDQCSLMSFLCF